MIVKTYRLEDCPEDDWRFEYEQGAEWVGIYRGTDYKGSMSLKELDALVEFKKAIDDLA